MEWVAAYFGFQTRQQKMGVGKVPGETERSNKWTEGNHDNLVSGTNQAPSQWEPRWRNAQILTKKTWEEKGGLGAKTARITSCESNMMKMIDFSKSATELQKPKITPYYIIWLLMETASQHCLSGV